MIGPDAWLKEAKTGVRHDPTTEGLASGRITRDEARAAMIVMYLAGLFGVAAGLLAVLL